MIELVAKTIKLIWNIEAIIAIDGQILLKYSENNIRKPKQHTDYYGYKYITVCNKGKRKNYKVHRLMGIAFLNLKENELINHLNGIKNDNTLNNLEVCNHSENMKHAVKIGLLTNKKGDEHNRCKHKFVDICEIRRLYKETKISMRSLAKQFSCSVGYISDIINNKIRTDK